MRMALLIGWLGVWTLASAEEKYPVGMTILETRTSGETQVVTGSNAERFFCFVGIALGIDTSGMIRSANIKIRL